MVSGFGPHLQFTLHMATGVVWLLLAICAWPAWWALLHGLAIPNTFLCLAILVVGINSTVLNSLVLDLGIIDKCIVSEFSTVCMIISYLHTMVFGKVLECYFGFHEFSTWLISLHVYKCLAEWWSTYTVAALYWALVRLPFICAISPIVDNSNESTEMHLPGILPGLIGLGLFFSAWSPGGLAKQTSCTFWGLFLSQPAWYHA